MKRVMRIILSLLICSSCFLLGIAQAADKYPVKPIEFIQPNEVGADGDVISRPVLAKVSQILGQPIMIINKPGAGGQLAAQALKAAAPDGSTFFLTHDHRYPVDAGHLDELTAYAWAIRIALREQGIRGRDGAEVVRRPLEVLP